MATWDEIRGMTWEQVGAFTWGDVARLTVEQIEQFTREAWPLLSPLSPAARRELALGLLDGSFPPPLLASAETKNTESQVAALSLWTRYAPRDSAELAAWVAILLSLLQILGPRESAPAEPPPVTVVILELPESVRPHDGVDVDPPVEQPAEPEPTESAPPTTP